MVAEAFFTSHRVNTFVIGSAVGTEEGEAVGQTDDGDDVDGDLVAPSDNDGRTVGFRVGLCAGLCVGLFVRVCKKVLC